MSKMKYSFFAIIKTLLRKSLLMFLFILSCGKNSEIIEKEEPGNNFTLAYMVADNNLDYFAVQDINEMEAGMPKNSPNKLLVYIDRGYNGNPSHPYLMEIIYDTTAQIVSKLVFTYPEQNSTDSQILEKVLVDSENYLPNHKLKGLVLWSHGNAWLPSGVSILTNRDKLLENKNQQKENLSKSFGADDVPKKSNMDIKDLAQILKKHPSEFIIFDACFMSSIEVLYELRQTTNYIIAAPTEILSSGFPYQDITPLLLDNHPDILEISTQFFNYYNQKSGLLRSASVSVVKTDEIEPLATMIKDFFSSITFQSLAEKENILELDRLNGEWIYDLNDFLKKTAQKNLIESEYEKINLQWNKTLIYENHTPYMVETINLENNKGISTYIPDTKHQKHINDYYKTLLWFNASGYDKIFSHI